jgi:hypothetical protein
MLHFIYCYAEYRYIGKCHYAECRYTECRFAECRGAYKSIRFMAPHVKNDLVIFVI